MYGIYSEHVGYVIRRAKRAPHWGVQSRFRVIYIYIYTKYSTLPRGISVYIESKVGIFSEAEGRGKYSLPRVQYMPIFHKEGFSIVYYIGYSLRGNYCIRSDVPIHHAQYQGWNIGVEHRNIFHPNEPI